MNINENQQNSLTYLLSTQRDAGRGNGSKLLHRAAQIVSSQGLTLLQFDDKNIVSYVAGSNGEQYRVAFLASGERRCACAFHIDNGADCKHLIAVALKLEAE